MLVYSPEGPLELQAKREPQSSLGTNAGLIPHGKTDPWAWLLGANLLSPSVFQIGLGYIHHATWNGSL